MSDILDEGRHNDAFRSGVKLVIAKHVWRKMKSEIAAKIGITFPIKHGNAVRVASEIYHTNVDYSRYENGGMSDKSLFSAMTLLGWKGKDLDELPSIEARATAGFQFAIYKICGGKSSTPKEHELIDPTVFNIIRKLIGHFLASEDDPNQIGIEDWKTLKSKYAPTTPGDIESLRELFFANRNCVAEAIDGVSFSWTDDFRVER